MCRSTIARRSGLAARLAPRAIVGANPSAIDAGDVAGEGGAGPEPADRQGVGPALVRGARATASTTSGAAPRHPCAAAVGASDPAALATRAPQLDAGRRHRRDLGLAPDLHEALHRGHDRQRQHDPQDRARAAARTAARCTAARPARPAPSARPWRPARATRPWPAGRRSATTTPAGRTGASPCAPSTRWRGTTPRRRTAAASVIRSTVESKKAPRWLAVPDALARAPSSRSGSAASTTRSSPSGR